MKNAYRKKRKFYLTEAVLVFSAIILFVFFGKWTARFDEKIFTESYVSVKEVGLELPFSVYSKEEWETFFATYKEPYLTNEMVTAILRKLGVSDVIPFEGRGTKRAVARSEWTQIYAQLLDYLDMEDKVSVKEVLILKEETSGTETFIHTDRGIYFTELPMDYFKAWQTYRIYLMGEACVGAECETKTEAVLSNVYLISAENGKLSFLFEGNIYEKEANLGNRTMEEGVADITVEENEIRAIGQKQDFIIGNLLSYGDTEIEIEGYGKLAHPGRVPVYQTYQGVEEKNISDIILGNMEVKYIIGEKEVCAILITAPAKVRDVRVLLLAGDGGKFRQEVYVTGDGKFTVSNAGNSSQFEPGTLINADEYSGTEADTITIMPELASDNLYLCNEKGERISNPYSGQMEIRKYEKGYCVVNQVPFETYLYSVVPSEMPSSYPMEALKAQAVCARSYAYIQVMRSDLAEYGAHISDSTSYQVYNNAAKTDASVRAVNETAGKVMMYQGNVIEAYYFSTSMGYTDTAQVWNAENDAAYGYLKKVCLNQQEFTGDLSQESDFKLYLTQDMTGYESEFKHYRWQIKADYKEQTEKIKEILDGRKAAVGRHITYYKEDGVTETQEMKGFGRLKSLSAEKRSASGSILTLKIMFEHGCAMVENEYNIRKVLAAGAEKITYQDGSENTQIALLPSAFCTVEKQGDGTYLLCGGGYGHGLGMSQNGANGLAACGYTYEEILHYFYNDIEITNIGES